MKSKSATIQMKATEQYFPVMLFIMLYKGASDFGVWIKVCLEYWKAEVEHLLGNQ